MMRILLAAFSVLLITSCVKDASFTTELAIDQRVINLNAVSDTARMMIYSSGSWTLEKRDTASWLIVHKASGSGQDYAIVSAPDNSASLPRAATLILRSGSRSDTVRLGQRGIVSKIAITATAVSSAATGGSIQTAIDANVPLNIMNIRYAYNEGNNWISGLQINNKNLVFDVGANTGSVARKAMIYLNYLDAIGVNTIDSLAVNQAKP